MKRRPAKPLFLIDASVPRNIDESVAKVDNVFPLQHGRCLGNRQREPEITNGGGGKMSKCAWQKSHSNMGTNDPSCHA
jgi:hypothetical protein